ncbi:MAG: response regulator [Myxococcales bacterium]|nr:response regulator [Myxococcales bacterium]
MSDLSTTGRLRILVIDDSPEILDYLRELLTHDDCLVDTMSSPTEALERLRRRNDWWHMLLLDLEMPELPGLRLLEKLRQVDRELPVIALTDNPTTEATSDAIALNVAAVVHKPFLGDEMRQTVARVARKHGTIVRAEDRLHVLVGRRISELRQERGMALKTLSRQSELPQSVLSQIERAEMPPSLSDLFKISRAFDISLSELVAIE